MASSPLNQSILVQTLNYLLPWSWHLVILLKCLYQFKNFKFYKCLFIVVLITRRRPRKMRLLKSRKDLAKKPNHQHLHVLLAKARKRRSIYVLRNPCLQTSQLVIPVSTMKTVVFVFND